MLRGSNGLAAEPSARPEPRPLFMQDQGLRGISSTQTTPADGQHLPRQHIQHRVSDEPPPHLQQYAARAPYPILSPSQEYHSGFADEDVGSPIPSPTSHHR